MEKIIIGLMISLCMAIQPCMAQDQSQDTENGIDDTGEFSIKEFIELWGCSECELLDAHNIYRNKVGTSNLTWSSSLAEEAQKWADYLASKEDGTLEHDPDCQYGENLWVGTSGSYTGTQMVDAWGSEEKNLIEGIPFGDNASKTGNLQDIGHYTQIIWADTMEVGCAKSHNNITDMDYLVCRYNPPGNFLGALPLGNDYENDNTVELICFSFSRSYQRLFSVSSSNHPFECVLGGTTIADYLLLKGYSEENLTSTEGFSFYLNKNEINRDTLDSTFLSQNDLLEVDFNETLEDRLNDIEDNINEPYDSDYWEDLNSYNQSLSGLWSIKAQILQELGRNSEAEAALANAKDLGVVET